MRLVHYLTAHNDCKGKTQVASLQVQLSCKLRAHIVKYSLLCSHFHSSWF